MKTEDPEAGQERGETALSTAKEFLDEEQQPQKMTAVGVEANWKKRKKCGKLKSFQVEEKIVQEVELLEEELKRGSTGRFKRLVGSVYE